MAEGNPSAQNPNCLDLLNTKTVRAYLGMLSDTGASGTSGQLTKNDQFMHGLRYICLKIEGNNAALTHRCNTMQECLGQWKAELHPQKKL